MLDRSAPRKKRSVLWSVPDLAERTLVATTFSEILVGLNLRRDGGNIKTLKNVLHGKAISFTHIVEGRNANGGKRFAPRYKTTSKDLSVDSKISRAVVRRIVLREELLVYECALCNLVPVWQNGILVLVLDHINGIFNDHRLENLRFLCPNCNSQTDTFAGRRRPYYLDNGV